RVVPEGERALVRVRDEVVAEPRLLRRAGAAAAHLRAVGVEGDQMPCADVEAVVALRAIAAPARLIADAVEVVEVPRCAGRLVLVIADRRVRELHGAAPGGVVDGLARV